MATKLFEAIGDTATADLRPPFDNYVDVMGTGGSNGVISGNVRYGVHTTQKRYGKKTMFVDMPEPGSTNARVQFNSGAAFRPGEETWLGFSWMADPVMNLRDYWESGDRWGAMTVGYRYDNSSTNNGPGMGLYVGRATGPGRNKQSSSGSRTLFYFRRDGRTSGVSDFQEYLDTPDIVSGRWYDIVHRIKWGATASGSIAEYWIDGKKVYSMVGQYETCPANVGGRAGRTGVYTGPNGGRMFIHWANLRIYRRAAGDTDAQMYSLVDPSAGAAEPPPPPPPPPVTPSGLHVVRVGDGLVHTDWNDVTLRTGDWYELEII